MCNAMRYNHGMIRSFANSEAERVFSDGVSKSLPPEVVKRARRKLFALDSACSIGDLRTPPGNRLHKLSGDRAGQYSISVNDKWRICFEFSDGDAHAVELCGYH